MKKVILGALAMLLSVSVSFAQGDLRAASRAYDNFALNGDATKLVEAYNNIVGADAGVEADKMIDYYLTAGNIYGAIAQTMLQDRQSSQLSPELAGLTAPMPEELKEVAAPAATASEMYIAAHGATDKRGKQRAALRGLSEIQQAISNSGIYALQDQDYASALTHFSASLNADMFLKDNGQESVMDSSEGNQRGDETYYAGLSALLLENYAAAKPFYMSLQEMDYGDDGSVYEGLYRIASAEGETEVALAYLREGRERYPEDNGLLFSEINYYLSIGELDALLDRLQTAIEREPENLGLYVTLGSVYDKLYQDAYAEGDQETATEYFDQAKNYYEQVLEKDASNSSAIYSLGALFYNRGANMSQQLEELADDLSREGQRRYEEVKATVDAEFENALPYFIQAEQLDPNDTNIIIALREMYARNGEYELSNEFKDRYERLDAGETLTSYFAN